MSLFLINKTIEDLSLSGLKIFYDFESYSGGHINSIEKGDGQYSGEVVNYSSSFTGQNSGSGFFDGEYIKINNTQNINSENATIIFSQQKTGISNGVIFSSLDSSGPSGWEVGINQANKYYFKNFVNGSEYYQTLDTNLSDKNLCAITVNQFGVAKIGKLDFSNKSSNLTNGIQQVEQDLNSGIEYYNFAQERVYVPQHSISNGSEWRIGSGEFLYKGYMDYFLYFDIELADEKLRQFARSMHSDVTFVPEVSGVESGFITGYHVTKSEVSGEIGIGYSGSGFETPSGTYDTLTSYPETGTVGVSGYVYVPHLKIDSISGTDQIENTIYKKIQNLSYRFSVTGEPIAETLSNYKSSGSYWNFSGNSGTYESQSAVGPSGHIFGITGFNSVNVTGYFTGSTQELFARNINSGIVYDEYSYSGMISPSTGYLISEARYINGKNRDSSYFSNAISLVGRFDQDDFHEVIYDIYEEGLINNQPTINKNSVYEKNVAYLSEDLDPNQAYLAINGVSQFTGSINLSKNQYNFPEFKVFSGFYVSGSEVFSELNLNNSDKIVYDIVHSGEKDSITINNISDYSSAPFVDFDFNESQVFLNGVKIYSGIDYIDSGGFFPISHSTGVTGFYFSYDNYSGAISFSGIGNNFATIKHNEITPVGYVHFLNGIRQSPSSIIEHAGDSDLISGTLINKEKNIIYNMINGVNQVL